MKACFVILIILGVVLTACTPAPEAETPAEPEAVVEKSAVPTEFVPLEKLAEALKEKGELSPPPQKLRLMITTSTLGADGKIDFPLQQTETQTETQQVVFKVEEDEYALEVEFVKLGVTSGKFWGEEVKSSIAVCPDCYANRGKCVVTPGIGTVCQASIFEFEGFIRLWEILKQVGLLAEWHEREDLRLGYGCTVDPMTTNLVTLYYRVLGEY